MAFFSEMYSWRHLLMQLVLKNLKLRYAAAAFGFVWAFLLPLVLSGIYYFVFSILLQVQTEGVPYALYLISGIFPWQFFQTTLLQGAGCLIEHKALMKESDFPRFIIPLSIVLTNAVHFLPALVLIACASVLTFKGAGFGLLFLPVIVFFYLLFAAGLTILVSILGLRFRDLPHFLEGLLLFLFYWTPIVYPLTLIQDSFSPALWKFYLANPFTGWIALFRVSLFPDFSPLPGSSQLLFLWGIPFFASIGCFWIAMIVYRKNKVWINDYLAY